MTRSIARAAGATAVAATLAFAPAAAGQFWIDLEPPKYAGSPAGEPLGGQDGWILETGAAHAWLVHTSGADPYGLPASLYGHEQFAAAHSSAGPASLQREVETRALFMVDVAVDFFGGVVSGEEIGRWALEPEGESASFALRALWSDPAAPGRWHMEVVHYAADGVERRTVPVVFEDLEPGRWYTFGVAGGIRILDVWIQDLATFKTEAFKPLDWYRAGGAAGLPTPEAISITSALGRDADAIFAVDNLRATVDFWTPDCNRDGQLDFFDYLCFQDAFAAGAPWADCDDSGDLTFFDFLCFQDSF